MFGMGGVYSSEERIGRMSKDGPKAGRMRFGYREHLEAGAPWLRSASVGQINLHKFMKKHAGRIDIMQEAKSRLDRGEPAGMVLGGLREAGYDGKLAIAYWRNSAFSGAFAEIRYGGDRAELEDWVAGLQRLGVCRSWLLWELNEKTGDWIERDWFPLETAGGGAGSPE
jgi:hypothetical protein